MDYCRIKTDNNKITGSRNRTIVFGCLILNGKQLFKQYDKFNSNIIHLWII
jgi:hypothetical protein